MRWLKDLVKVFYTPICVGCKDRAVLEKEWLCLHCRMAIPATDLESLKKNEMIDRFKGRFQIEAASSLFYVSESPSAKNILWTLKYRDAFDLGVWLGCELGERLLASDQFKDISAIVPVPLHPKKLKSRGYNQAEAFGKGLSEKMKMPMRTDILVRKNFTKSQTKKSRFARMKGLREAFDLNPTISECPSHVLLVDDVVTTGSTIECCAELLFTAGVKQISLASIAFATE